MAVNAISCGACAECCRLLEVGEIGKPADVACRHARPGITAGCCAVYAERPAACAQFRCLFLASQERADPAERLAPALRPDRMHVVFYRNGGEADPRTITAHVDPAFPDAWLAEPAQGEIRRLIARGAIVVVEIGERRVVLQPDRPPHFDVAARPALAAVH